MNDVQGCDAGRAFRNGLPYVFVLNPTTKITFYPLVDPDLDPGFPTSSPTALLKNDTLEPTMFPSHGVVFAPSPMINDTTYSPTLMINETTFAPSTSMIPLQTLAPTAATTTFAPTTALEPNNGYDWVALLVGIILLIAALIVIILYYRRKWLDEKMENKRLAQMSSLNASPAASNNNI